MIKGLFLLFVLSFTSQVSAKKALPIEKESPPSETEIVCFAALEQWVCAPESDQQQAKDKAMRLIDEQTQQGKVVIQTLPAEQQWREVVVEEPLAEPQVPVQSDVNTSDQATSQSAVEALGENSTETEFKVAEEIQPAQQVNEQGHSERFVDWRLAHPDAWVLQLVGTTNLPNLEQFIVQHQLSSQRFSIATTEVKGAPWHIVLVGVFNSRDEALAHRSGLAQNLQSAWPRPIAGIESIE